MLEGRVAIVTGAGGGIGSAIARRLASSGAKIVVNDLDEPAAQAVAAEVEALGREAMVNAGSVADLAAMEAMVAGALERWGTVDIMVNNAGITRDSLLLKMTEEQWDLVIAVHLRGAFCCTKAVTRPMMKQRYGRIINVASVVGVMGSPGQANYSAAKGGIIALTKTTARELAGRNITCNAVAPGFIETRMTEALGPAVREEYLSRIPLGRPGLPEDVANVIHFLASPDADYITGQVIHIDGGMVM
ncbi:MAG: 3-oxoacyl-[acyl-carrier-protein] reductase [Armatimonadetes bacterium]|nr:3-oxoacyl-[acyl-carrier-protein] reductase [Armatimonadota bacterium]